MDYKAEQSKRMKLIILELDGENKQCADCSSEKIEYASINNGTIICSDCAEVHKKFETKLSFLKAFSERWDDYLLSYVKMGSNGRFCQFAKTYRIDKIPIEKKYKTRACEYYRDLIRSEVMGYEPPDGINIRTAGEVLEVFEDNYPEFENYSYVKHVDLDNLEKKLNKKEEDNGLIGAVTEFFGNVTSKIDTAADYVAGLNVGEKMLEEGSKAINAMKTVVNENTKKLQGFIDDMVGSDKDEGKGYENSEDVPKAIENQENQQGDNIEKLNAKSEVNEGNPKEEVIITDKEELKKENTLQSQEQSVTKSLEETGSQSIPGEIKSESTSKDVKLPNKVDEETQNINLDNQTQVPVPTNLNDF